MRAARTFVVPYDSGHRAFRMGNGPLRLIENMPPDEVEIIEATAPFRAEVQTSFELYRKLAERVHAAVQRKEMPVVLSGNCGACNGTAAGLGADDLAVIWFDAHGDLMTPETTVTGFLDGMAMAILAGFCWTTMASSIPRFAPVAPERMVHVGGRDFSPGEERAFATHGISLVRSGGQAILPVLDRVAKLAKRILIHVDMDVIDPRFGHANSYTAPDGLSPDDVLAIIAACRERFEIAAIDIASFDPSGDDRGLLAGAARSYVEAARAS